MHCRHMALSHGAWKYPAARIHSRTSLLGSSQIRSNRKINIPTRARYIGAAHTMLLVFAFVAFLSWNHAANADPVPPLPSPAVMLDSFSGITPQAKAELERFYALRDNRPVWNLSNGEAQNLIDSIDKFAVYHGLEKSAYRLEKMRKLAASASEVDKQTLELLVTASLLHVAHDMHGDNVNLENRYPGWNFHRQAADFPVVLNAAIADGNLGAFFQQLAPQHQSYHALAAALQTYSAIEAKGGWSKIVPGSSLRPQDKGDRVAQLRARLTAEGYKASSTEEQEDFFDDGLSQALVAYQTHNGLTPDGHAGPKTQESLNVPVAARIAQIRANMERWRRLPEDFLPERYIMVNIPDFTLTVHENGAEIYSGAVVDGRADRRTPFIDSRIFNVVVNPSWHVPRSIARKDILPKLRKDPLYLERLGIVIKGREEDPSGTTIDWRSVSSSRFNYEMRQVPGDLNSLGQLKFNFRNPFDVYMHGTPHQELFKKDERDFSSGCVRVEDPMRVGEILLEDNKDNGGWDQQRISDEIDAEKTHFITLANPMPVYFLYWSVFSGNDGQLNFRKDIYGYDLSLMDAIKNASLLPPDR
jgi:murein L,D-transpeptidase YcbB/YkuD